ncbi:MAG: hypothetical protein J0H64_10595, partial [Actinobacteria bacterium]|nr:hypothetical protein [Actinomycetota bacterium]
MMNAITRRRSPKTKVVTALASTVMLAISGFGLASPAVAAGPTLPTPDGLTQASAAASCWEIKQNTPNAPSGVYWLATPALGGAQQFYCDQTAN